VTAGARQRLRRGDRLRHRRDYQRISREGARVATQSFLLLVADRFPRGSMGPARLGVTVSRRVGGSVVRSRVKRRIREWFRRDRERLPRDRDLIVIARPPAARLGPRETERELGGATDRLAGAARREAAS
jgi:ribonuclease P protein component